MLTKLAPYTQRHLRIASLCQRALFLTTVRVCYHPYRRSPGALASRSPYIPQFCHTDPAHGYCYYPSRLHVCTKKCYGVLYPEAHGNGFEKKKHPCPLFSCSCSQMFTSFLACISDLLAALTSQNLRICCTFFNTDCTLFLVECAGTESSTCHFEPLRQSS